VKLLGRKVKFKAGDQVKATWSVTNPIIWTVDSYDMILNANVVLVYINAMSHNLTRYRYFLEHELEFA
jgi:hypothetical protein